MTLRLNINPAPFPGAPVLVLSAGLGGTAGYWLPQQPLERDYQLVHYDQRGTGNNPDTLPDNYDMAQMARELHLALAQAGITRYALLGHALGGLMGMQLALDYPGALSALIVINGWLSLSPRTARCFALREAALHTQGPEGWIAAQPLFLYPPDWLAEHEAQLEAEHSLQACHFQGEHNLLRRLQALKQADFRPRAAEIDLPVLAIASRDDLLVPWLSSQVLHDALPRCQLEVLDWGGHACNVTSSQAINTLIHDWLTHQHLLSPVPYPATTATEAS